MNIVRRVQTLERRAALTRTAPPPPPLPVNSPADLVRVLAEQVNAVRADVKAGPVERARTVGMLAAVALRAIEAGETQARLDAVERALRIRPAPPRGNEEGR